jgi:hypothetical protein
MTYRFSLTDGKQDHLFHFCTSLRLALLLQPEGERRLVREHEDCVDGDILTKEGNVEDDWLALTTGIEAPTL